jgi:hypothetical protein
MPRLYQVILAQFQIDVVCDITFGSDNNRCLYSNPSTIVWVHFFLYYNRGYTGNVRQMAEIDTGRLWGADPRIFSPFWRLLAWRGIGSRALPERRTACCRAGVISELLVALADQGE